MSDTPRQAETTSPAAIGETRRLDSAFVNGLVLHLREIFRRRNEGREELEGTVGKQLRNAQVTFREDVQRLETEFGQETDEHEDSFRQQQASLLGDLDRVKSEAEQQRLAERERTAEAYGEDYEKIARQLQEAVWLAETVYEANEEKPGDKFNATKTELERLRELLVKKENETLTALAGVRQAGVAKHIPESDELDPPMTLADVCAGIDERLVTLAKIPAARLFAGANPVILAAIITAIPAVVATWLNAWNVGRMTWIGAGIGAAIALVLLIVAYAVARKHVRAWFIETAGVCAEGHRAAVRELKEADERRKTEARALVTQRNDEIQKAKERFQPVLDKIRKSRQAKTDKIDATFASKIGASEREASGELNRATEEHQQRSTDAQRTRDQRAANLTEDHTRRQAELRETYAKAQQDLIDGWVTGVRDASDRSTWLDETCARIFPAWEEQAWARHELPEVPPTAVRFGSLSLDVASLEGDATEDTDFPYDGPQALELPALLDIPDRACLLIETDPKGRQEALDAIRGVMARILTTFPPGQARFTIFDPVGLGESFAGFMHLADYEEALVSDRIWTEQRHIERRLADLTEHMENVIQKYLRNEFETISEYNERAGEVAEPYRFLVVADFPANFNDSTVRRLASVLRSGPRCGVFTLIVRDTSQRMPAGLSREDLESRCVRVVRKGGRFALAQDTLALPFRLETAPSEGLLTRITRRFGQAAHENSRVEVPFGVVSPPPGREWTEDCSEELSVPIGRAGATKIQSLTLGRGTLQHVLIAGKTGSGKSTLLHVLITNLALWHHPDEVQFYLIDFKKGVEFKAYASHHLPHARAVAIESEREFGLSVLQEVDAELHRRGSAFRELGVQDLAGYRRHPAGGPMARTLLIIDEFQELFTEDDKLAQEASLLLDRLVRQGRAFGIHVILGSQTLGGAYTLARSTMGQMGVRIALQCSEADSYLILNEDNAAARLLARPGEAIYNDASGLLEGNTPFQIVWLSENERDRRLEDVEQRSANDGYTPPRPQVVFEGNTSADPARSTFLQTELDRVPTGRETEPVRLWLGNAVAIKDPTSVLLERHAGGNTLIVGQREREAAGIANTAVLCALSQLRETAGARIVIVNGLADELSTTFGKAREAFPNRVRLAARDRVTSELEDVHRELQARRDADERDRPPIVLFLLGLHTMRELRRSGDDFSFGFGDDDKPATPDQLLGEILDEGPLYGVHVLLWCDAAPALNRAIERRRLRAFETRVLFQMSQNDSSDLIDSVLAARLGENRALLFQDDTGEAEKFHPYGVPTEKWIDELLAKLGKRT